MHVKMNTSGNRNPIFPNEFKSLEKARKDEYLGQS